MNIEYAHFPDLGFHGKNLCVMFVFPIVSFLLFYEYLFVVDIVQGYNLQVNVSFSLGQISMTNLEECLPNATHLSIALDKRLVRMSAIFSSLDVYWSFSAPFYIMSHGLQ
jgi:hypothetical protein